MIGIKNIAFEDEDSFYDVDLGSPGSILDNNFRPRIIQSDVPDVSLTGGKVVNETQVNNFRPRIIQPDVQDVSLPGLKVVNDNQVQGKADMPDVSLPGGKVVNDTQSQGKIKSRFRDFSKKLCSAFDVEGQKQYGKYKSPFFKVSHAVVNFLLLHPWLTCFLAFLLVTTISVTVSFVLSEETKTNINDKWAAELEFLIQASKNWLQKRAKDLIFSNLSDDLKRELKMLAIGNCPESRNVDFSYLQNCIESHK